MAKNTKNVVKKASIAGPAILIVLMIILNVACVAFADMISIWFASTSSLDYATREKGEKLATQIVEEGVVLVKNEEQALPLNKEENAKVNVFGWAASEWVGGGSGSGRVVGNTNNNSMTPETPFLEALENADIEYNKDIINMYENFQGNREGWNSGALNQSSQQFHRLYEPSIEDSNYYTSELLDGAAEFSDTAIVVLGRVSGESNDPASVQWKRNVRNGSIITDDTRTYLDISTEEEELLEYVSSNFAKVIVVINSTNTMNLNFMDHIDNLSACIIAGCTGNNAANGLVNVLYGEDMYSDEARTVSPSGRVADTYAYDFATAAAYATAGDDGIGRYIDTNGLYPTTKSTVNGDTHYRGAVSYLDYYENIYVGYKWYETADAEGYWANVSNEYGEGYEGVVQYPFGYGLSYTTFDWDVMSTEPASGALDVNGKITMTVRVTNTGTVAGKEVVQAYYTAPYVKNGIEKSHVVLAAFAKTPIDVEPGKSQDLTLTFDVRDMASYDSQEIKVAGGGYILEAGEYTVKLMKNSHELAEVGIGAAEHTYTLAEDYIYTTSKTTGNPIHNLFTGEDCVDGVSIDGSETNEGIEWLTRGDFAGTFKSEKPNNRELREMDQKLRDTNLYKEAHVDAWEEAWNEANDQLSEADKLTMPTQGVTPSAALALWEKDENNNSIISDLGLELASKEGYNDERWDAVLDQVTMAEMRNLTLHGYVKESAVESVGKDFVTRSVDGPAQAGSFNVTDAGTGYPNATTLAQSFNTQLGKSFGSSLAADAKGIGYSGLYAPGVNIHRTAFGGRNYEYYSEDAYLTGAMGASVINGCLDGGIYVYVKHFIIYEQDTARDGMYPWMTEQAFREIYLAPFNMLIEDANVSGLMSSYGRLCGLWTGGNQGLLTNLLRTEMGFQGAVLTDYADHHEFMNGDQMLRAGGDIWMDGYQNNGAYDYQTTSVSMVHQLRRATKNVLYMILNADYRMLNASEDNIPVAKASGTNDWWPYMVAGIDAVVLLLCFVWMGSISKKNKKLMAEASGKNSGKKANSKKNAKGKNKKK